MSQTESQSPEELVPVQFLCPPKLLEAFDRVRKACGYYSNRTDALKRLMERFVDSGGQV